MAASYVVMYQPPIEEIHILPTLHLNIVTEQYACEFLVLTIFESGNHEFTLVFISCMEVNSLYIIIL